MSESWCEIEPAGYLEGVPVMPDCYIPTWTPAPRRRDWLRWFFRLGPRPERHRIMYVIRGRQAKDVQSICASPENCGVLLATELPDDCRSWRVHEMYPPEPLRVVKS